MPWGLRVTRIGNWKTEPRSPLWLCLPGSFAWGLPVSLLRGPQGHRSVDSSLPLSFHSVRLASWSEGPSCLFLLYPSQKILQVNILHLISVSHLGVHSSEDLNSTPLLLSPPLWAAGHAPGSCVRFTRPDQGPHLRVSLLQGEWSAVAPREVAISVVTPVSLTFRCHSPPALPPFPAAGVTRGGRASRSACWCGRGTRWSASRAPVTVFPRVLFSRRNL